MTDHHAKQREADVKKCRYEYGVEYPTNGQKPDLPDDVLVEFKNKEEDQFSRMGAMMIGSWAWPFSSAFRIVDERYKPALQPTTIPDWSKAPSEATHYADGSFLKELSGFYKQFLRLNEKTCFWKAKLSGDIERYPDYQERPKPPAIAQEALKDADPVNRLETSLEYLSACAQVQSERAKQYDANGTGERSFEAAAEAFNCVTGKNIRGSDVCLILEMVKLVRQYSDPTRLHADSVLDKVSYSALWAEELTKELR